MDFTTVVLFILVIGVWALVLLLQNNLESVSRWADQRNVEVRSRLDEINRRLQVMPADFESLSGHLGRLERQLTRQAPPDAAELRDIRATVLDVRALLENLQREQERRGTMAVNHALETLRTLGQVSGAVTSGTTCCSTVVATTNEVDQGIEADAAKYQRECP